MVYQFNVNSSPSNVANIIELPVQNTVSAVFGPYNVDKRTMADYVAPTVIHQTCFFHVMQNAKRKTASLGGKRKIDLISAVEVTVVDVVRSTQSSIGAQLRKVHRSRSPIMFDNLMKKLLNLWSLEGGSVAAFGVAFGSTYYHDMHGRNWYVGRMGFTSKCNIV